VAGAASVAAGASIVDDVPPLLHAAAMSANDASSTPSEPPRRGDAVAELYMFPPE
jgi:hypothetical protein